MTSLPIVYEWTGSEMRPLGRFAKSCDRDFVIGERYMLAEQQDRSSRSHAHYFAALNDAWQSLPDDQGDRFPTSEHLRKFALIKTGFADSRQFVASSEAEAVRLAAFIQPSNTYALVTIEQLVVTVWTAQSQSMKDMGKERFQASKTAVLDYVAVVLGTTRQEIEEAGAA